MATAKKNKNKKKNTSKDRKFGWHFLPADCKLTNGDGRKVVVGVRLSIDKNQMPTICDHGLHASKFISQAVDYEKGPVLCRVLVEGDIDTTHNKFCGRHRTVLWMREIKDADIRDFAKKLSADKSFTPGWRGLEEDLYYLASFVGFTAFGKVINGPTQFDKIVEEWAVSHGANLSEHVKLPKTLPAFVVPRLTEEDLAKLLGPRMIRTKREILRDLGKSRDLDPCDGDFYEDRFDEIVDNSTRIVEIDDFDRAGTAGYVLAITKRSR